MRSSKSKQAPPLVVVDTKQCVYHRYVGKQRTDALRSEYPMTASMIEQFRVDPESIYETDDNETA